MSKSLRLSEKWFRRGLWLVAFVFAGFLIGLGGSVVDDLPKVEGQQTTDDYIDKPQAELLRERIRASERTQNEAAQELQQAQLKLRSAQADSATQRDSFEAWIATRAATQLDAQNPDVIARTRELGV